MFVKAITEIGFVSGTLHELLISGAMDCDSAVIWIQAMRNKSFPANNLVLHLDKSCRGTL